jgi:hypothetical protein
VILRCPRWILLLALTALTGPAWAEAPPGFEGRWRVLEDSQKAVEKALRGARRELRRGRGQAVLRDLRVPEATLAIALEDGAVHFRFDDRPRPPLYTDGRPSVIDSENPVLRFAAWEEDTLYVERTNNSGTRIEEQWRLTTPPPPREGAEPPPVPWLEGRFLVRNALLEAPLELRLLAEPLKDAADAF